MPQTTVFSPPSILLIDQINEHLQAAFAAFGRLQSNENQACLMFHTEGYSLNHCVRWGAQAAEELVQQLKNGELKSCD